MTASTLTPQMSLSEQVSLEKITPEMAEKMLVSNKNRSLDARYVSQLAAAMKRGEWKLTNDAITFGVNGQLLNGQHRLSAIVLSRVTLELLVLRNVGKESQTFMDIGKKRTYQDHLQIMTGQRTTQVLSSFLKLYLALEDLSHSKKNFEVSAVASYLDKSGTSFALLDSTLAKLGDRAIEALTLGRRLTYSRKEVERPVSLAQTGVAMGVFLTRRASRGTMNEVNVWEDGLLTGAELGPNDPRLRLRTARLSVKHSRASNIARDVTAYCKCFNAWVKGESVKSLNIREEEFFSFPIGGNPFAD